MTLDAPARPAADASEILRADAPAFACRSCGSTRHRLLVDLGTSPPCQNVVRPEALGLPETFFPLRAYVCESCSLVQIDAEVPPDAIFSEYAYFSSYSDSWVEHARRYVETVVRRFGLGESSLVVEIASNDGYLLQHVRDAGVPCLGVEPAANVAAVARERGIPTRVAFFGEDEAAAMVAEGLRADLIAANNVLAHTPHLNSFVAGLKRLLAPSGVITVEFPHLLALVEQTQFDTIYHEHFSYFSFTAVERVFARHGLELFDVDELSTHGGSLRIYARHTGTSAPESPRAGAMREREREWGVDTAEPYRAFGERVRRVRRDLLAFLIEAAREGRTVAGYGAPGKGNTLLNYCGIRPDLLAFTVDRNPYKQGTFTPGARIPVLAPEHVAEARPDYLLILPWNLRDEIAGQMAGIREWGGQFVVPIPELEIF